MEPIFKNAGKLKGTEVLFFNDVELEKGKGGSPSFASVGTLSVLFFKDFNRFVLHLNDWSYPLMRRIPITSGGESGSHTLTLPALNGFDYTLRFPNVSEAAWSNFETILSNNSGFGGSKKLEASPDDKLSRQTIQQQATGLADKLSQAFKQGVSTVKGFAGSLKPTGSKTSTKGRMALKDIKNKNFKKEAHSTFKKDFFQTEETLSKKFTELRGHNKNLSEVLGFDDLRKTNDSTAPSLYLLKEEIEASILNNKDLIEQRHFVASS